jgi:SET domain-containing protein
LPRLYQPRSSLSDALVIGLSGIEGNGIFARRDIHPGEVVIVFGGMVIDDARLEAGHPHSSLAIAEGRHLLHAADDPAQYLNHSCDSNAWMRDDVTVIARRRIEAGEELTLDYALVTVNPNWGMGCNCGASTCRGAATGNDWQRVVLQRRYEGHFSPFINDRIRRYVNQASA